MREFGGYGGRPPLWLSAAPTALTEISSSPSFALAEYAGRAVKSLPCAWKFRLRISSLTTATAFPRRRCNQDEVLDVAMCGDDDVARNGGESAKGT